MTETLPFVTVDMWTMIFTWLNLVILLLLMKKFLFKPVQNIIALRQKEVDEMYDSAASDKKKSAEMKEEYEQKLANAKKEASEIISNASRTAQLKSEELLNETKALASNIIKKAEHDISLEKKAAVEDAKAEISDLAIAVAGKVLEKDLTDTEHEKLVEKCIDEIGECL